MQFSEVPSLFVKFMVWTMLLCGIVGGFAPDGFVPGGFGTGAQNTPMPLTEPRNGRFKNKNTPSSDDTSTRGCVIPPSCRSKRTLRSTSNACQSAAKALKCVRKAIQKTCSLGLENRIIRGFGVGCKIACHGNMEMCDAEFLKTDGSINNGTQNGSWGTDGSKKKMLEQLRTKERERTEDLKRKAEEDEKERMKKEQHEKAEEEKMRKLKEKNTFQMKKERERMRQEWKRREKDRLEKEKWERDKSERKKKERQKMERDKKERETNERDQKRKIQRENERKVKEDKMKGKQLWLKGKENESDTSSLQGVKGVKHGPHNQTKTQNRNLGIINGGGTSLEPNQIETLSKSADELGTSMGTVTGIPHKNPAETLHDVINGGRAEVNQSGNAVDLSGVNGHIYMSEWDIDDSNGGIRADVAIVVVYSLATTVILCCISF